MEVGEPATAAPQEPERSEWPQSGFEPFFEYSSTFIHLNTNLGSADACRKYHDAGMMRFRRAMADWSDLDIAIWSVRVRQSLKLAFSATYFALSSRELRDQQAMAASSYLAYYAAVHAMWGVLYLEPNEAHERLTNISHARLAATFASKFTGTDAILRVDAGALVEDLRFLREYYSYRMPLNAPIDAGEDIASAYVHLGGFVKQSIQLANLHSHLIRKAAERCGKQCVAVAPPDRERFSEVFFQMNGKAHGGRNVRALDPADRQAEREFLGQGCDILPLSVAYDHMSDDFMTYVDGSQPGDKIIAETGSLVFNALF